MWMGEERISKKMLDQKWKENDQEETQNQVDRPNQKVYKRERGENGKKCKKPGRGRIETAGAFPVIVDPYLWKLFKNDNDITKNA